MECPYYIAMGMTYDQFWKEDVWIARTYRQAYEIKRKEEEMNNYRIGLYVYHALCMTVPNLGGEVPAYLKRPFPLTQKEADEQEEYDRAEKYYSMKARLFAKAQKMRGGK